jgi:hypothetical protein
MESFDVELYQAHDVKAGNHMIVSTPVFGTRELVSEVTIRLRRRAVPF